MEILRIRIAAWPAQAVALWRKPGFVHLLVAAAVSAAVLAGAPSPARAAHPDIVVTAEEFDGLRARAANEPFRSIATNGIIRANSFRFDRPSGGLCRDIASAIALAYIVDNPANRPAHAQRFHQEMKVGLPWLIEVRGDPPRQDRSFHVGYANCVFHTIIALDILYNDLTSEQIAELEASLTTLIDGTNNNWYSSTLAMLGVWAMYRGETSETCPTPETSTLCQIRSEYIGHFEYLTGADGVVRSGPTYGVSRMTAVDRDQKHLFMHILERHGFHDFYDNPRYRTMYRWLFGHAIAPGGMLHGFGDTDPQDRIDPWNSSIMHAAGRFGDDVARLAARHRVADPPVGRLMTYLLYTPPPEDAPPGTFALAPSKVYPKSGAWFVDRLVPKPDTLVGALWNMNPASDSHMRMHTNDISLTGYGQLLLTQPGYYGGTVLDCFGLDYRNRRSISGNTGMIDYDPLRDGATICNPALKNGHRVPWGGGITRSLLSVPVDYALGDTGVDGSMKPYHGRHERGFAFVHSTATEPGYWVLFDEFFPGEYPPIWPDPAERTPLDAPVSLSLHPYGDTVREERAHRLYSTRIHTLDREPTDIRLSIFLATEPQTVQIFKGPLPSHQGTFGGDFLFPTYAGDPGGRPMVVTALLPSDPDHPRPGLARVGGAGWNGMRAWHASGAVDYAVRTTAPIRNGSADIDAVSAIYRLRSGALDFAFFRGDAFAYRLIGLAADAPIIAAFSQGGWKMHGKQAVNVRVHTQGIANPTVQVDGVVADDVVVANGIARLQVPAGFHTVRVVSR